MVTFTKEQITEHIWRLRGLGDVCMYYIQGSIRGALIDTAYGVGDLDISRRNSRSRMMSSSPTVTPITPTGSPSGRTYI